MPQSRSFSHLTTAQLDQIDAICDRFTADLTSGAATSIEEVLTGEDEALVAALLEELLDLEINSRRDSAKPATVGEYRARFPEFTDVVEQVFADPSDRGAGEITRLIDADDTDPFVSSLPQGSGDDASCDGLPREFGRYRLLKLLGRGGMGAVYLAHDTQLDRQVALKMPEFGGRRDVVQPMIDRFHREARAMATVSHPNICQIHDVGEYDGHPFLTMAYLEGQPLSEVIADRQQLGADEAVGIILTLARAVDAIHQAGIIHRDLKPANVMLSVAFRSANDAEQPRKPRVFITDFGLATRDNPLEADLTDVNTVIGSPAYMAPEQVRAEHDRIGPATDVYALGVILYELLCGRRPFTGGGLGVLGEITSGNAPPRPSELSDIDERLEAICLKAMAHNVEDRYQSAAELALALEQFSVGRPDQVGIPDQSQRSSGVDVASQRRLPERRRYAPRSGLLLVLVAVVVSAEAILNKIIAPESPDRGIGVVSRQELAEPAVSEHESPTTAPTNPPAAVRWDSWRPAQKLSGPVNHPLADGSPTLTADQLTLVFHRPIPDPPHYYQLWMSQRSAVDEEFGEPVLLGPEVNQGTSTNPHISPDGMMLVFDSRRPDGYGGSDIWLSRRASIDDAWSPATALGPSINTPGDESNACLTMDGRMLAFASNREGGHGINDVWIAVRENIDTEFESPHNAGPLVNGPGEDGYPFLSSDGLVLLFGSHPGPLGGWDLFISERDSVDAPFRKSVHLGPQVNSSGHDAHGWLSPDGSSIYFESDREGPGRYDIYHTKRVHSSPGLAERSHLLPPIPKPTRRSSAHFVESAQQFDESAGHPAAGDLDGDGDWDLVVVNKFTSQPARVWLNDGMGAFEKKQEFAWDSPSYGIALGDVDADGDLDVFVANKSRSVASSVWLNDGGGEFEDSGQSIGPVYIRCVRLGDVDGDGDLDALTTNLGPNYLWRNDGTGRFLDSGQRLGNADTRDIQLADLDADGDLDALITNFGSASRVWINDGKGNFIDSGQRLGGETSMGTCSALFDVDDDGDLDAFLLCERQPSHIWINDGAASFTSVLEQDTGTLPSVRIVAADFNGDQRDDFFVSNGAALSHRPDQLLLATDRGFVSTWLGDHCTASTAVADFDNDGALDIFLGSVEGVEPHRLLLNQDEDRSQSPYFRDSGQSLGNSVSNHVVLADLDEDGDLDAFITNYKAPDTVWRNTGKGIFVDSGQQLGNSRSVGAQFGDLDGDGDQDAFVTNIRGQPNRVYLNDGRGVFRDSGQLLGNSGSNAVALRDFDGDGDLDAFDVNYGNYGDGAANRLYLNDGLGKFTDSGQKLGNSTSHGLAVGDFDGDGDDDVFVANEYNQPNRLYLNTGAGIFQDSGQALGKSTSYSAIAGDIDGDSDIDILVANDGYNRVWLNDGQASFTESGHPFDASTSTSITLADVDQDGDLDAFVSNCGPNSLWRNDGHGVLGNVEWIGAGQKSNHAVLADLNGDGTLDVFVVNEDGPDRVWLGTAR